MGRDSRKIKVVNQGINPETGAADNDREFPAARDVPNCVLGAFFIFGSRICLSRRYKINTVVRNRFIDKPLLIPDSRPFSRNFCRPNVKSAVDLPGICRDNFAVEFLRKLYGKLGFSRYGGAYNDDELEFF